MAFARLKEKTMAQATQPSNASLPSQASPAQKRFDEKLSKIRRLYDKHEFPKARLAALALSSTSFAREKPLCFIVLAEILNDMGYLSDAETLCNHAIEYATGSELEVIAVKKSALYLLGAIAAEAACHDLTQSIDRKLLKIFPKSQDVFFYLIFHASYDPQKSPRQQKALARCWAKKAQPQSMHRPPARPLHGRPLRVGYVSGDFKVHPVGFFLRGIIASHDRTRLRLFAYNAGKDDDNPILHYLAGFCTLRHVAALSDQELEKLIRDDAIDLLVDLSGFTTHNRLTVFARQPAPTMISWLGYWASTGLDCLDAVLLDPWHAPPGSEKEYVEPIVRLPVIRFCYQPISEEPLVDPTLPCLKNGYITFGCFNNTTKLNAKLLDVWARILAQQEQAHLLLKWKTFHDPAMGKRILQAFERRGIEPSRIELRGWSPHQTMLAEYHDVDIALDTFPFSGGITTCNALWMGVPVVTLIGQSVVGRQGYAILKQLDLEELCACNTEHYIKIATGLASDLRLLLLLHVSLRERLRHSPLLDVAGFTKHLEAAFFQIYEARVEKDAGKNAES